MSNEIISVIDHLCDKLGIAVDWTADNAMPMIQQLIEKYARYLLAESIVTAIGCIFLLVFGVCLLIKTEKSFHAGTWARDHNFECIEAHSGVGTVGLVASGCAIFIGAIGVMFSVSDLIKIITIPEIYAAQELLSMLSNM